MIKAIPAIFDGNNFLLETPVKLKTNTRVLIQIESIINEERPKTKSFLETARSLNIDGPEDWSDRIDYYLYQSQNENE